MEDKDGDGWGDNTPTSSAITAGTDCHDSIPSIYPGAAYAEDPTACMMDADGDGWGDETPSYAVATRGNDCDDADAGVNPGAEEVCDRDDDNCDGRADLGDVNEWHTDTDGDGYGHIYNFEVTCDPDPSWVLDGSDCRPGDAEAFPGAAEVAWEMDGESLIYWQCRIDDWQESAGDLTPTRSSRAAWMSHHRPPGSRPAPH
jgi:hypothetical protein